MRADPRYASRTRRRPAATPPEPPALVLIADDDETARLVLQRAFAHSGAIALPVDDGVEIWPILARERVETLVLDLRMPGMNGFDVIRHIRGREAENSLVQRIGIIAVSGIPGPDVEARALRLGADAFRAKPLDIFEVVRIASELRVRRQRALPRTQHLLVD